MTLTLADFAPIVDALTSNVPIIVVFVVSMYSLNYIIQLVRHYANTPDPVDVRAREVLAENRRLNK